MRSSFTSKLGLVVLLAFIRLGAAQDRAYTEALELHKSGDLPGAERAYRQVIESDPARFDARSNLGAVLSAEGRYEDAIAQYREALNSAPRSASPHLRMNLAIAYYKSFQIPQASAELESMDRDLNATLLLADCHLRMGGFKRVIELLQPLEPQQPGNRALTYLLGMALIRDGQVEAGQRRVDLILRDGDSAEGRFLLATGMFMAHDYPGAVKAFERAISLNPAVPSLQSVYGQALLATGDADGAAAAFRKELAANPNDYDANLGLGEILAARGGEAKPFLERALLLRPGSVEARRALDGKSGPALDATGIAPGTLAPDFEPLGLSRDRGKRPVVLVFGSYTCPQFRGGAPALNAAYAKYNDRARFVLVYINEAHAGAQWQSTINEREGIDMRPARDIAEKQDHAGLCVRKLAIGFPSVTDGMDGKIESAYDAWPSRVYVIGKDGRVIYNSRFGELNFHADQLEKTLEQ